MPATFASARLYWDILSRNSWRAASISTSGFRSSRPLMNSDRKPRTSLPTRAMSAIYAPPGECAILHEPAKLINPSLDLFGRLAAVGLGEEASVGALLDGHQIHVLQLAGVGARANLREHVHQNVPQRASRLGLELEDAKRPDHDALDLIAPQDHVFGKWRDV